MRIIILLYCVWLASAGTAPDKCDVVTFNGKYYDKEVLLTHITGVDGFSLDKSTNTLFFSYIYPPEPVYSGRDYGIAYYNIDTKEFKDILEVNRGYTTAINPETGDVYLGGSDGIYKYNSLNKTAVPYAAQGVNIFFLYVRCTLLYYTTSPDDEIYIYDGKETKKVSNVKVSRFIGDEENYFFVNSTGLYRVLDNKEENAELYSISVSNNNRFAKDKNNKIFVTGNNFVYAINKEQKKVDEIAHIKDRDLVFDKNNNIIYSDDDSIYRLTPSEATCPPDSL